jgi:hypothetical protein
LLRAVFCRRIEHGERNILFRKMTVVERKQIGNLPYEIDARLLQTPPHVPCLRTFSNKLGTNIGYASVVVKYVALSL